MDAADVIERLGLVPHPEEGGFFRETYRAGGELPAGSLGGAYEGPRRFSTAIYYLLTPETRSELHLLPTDEVFHFYAGDPVEQLRLHPDGTAEVVVLGSDLAVGQQPQSVVAGGVWQGAHLAEGGAWALLGCTVAPGFEFADYTPGDRRALTAAHPDHAPRIARLTREPSDA